MHAAKPTAGPRSKALYNGCNENDTRSHDRGASGAGSSLRAAKAGGKQCLLLHRMRFGGASSRARGFGPFHR